MGGYNIGKIRYSVDIHISTILLSKMWIIPIALNVLLK